MRRGEVIVLVVSIAVGIGAFVSIALRSGIGWALLSLALIGGAAVATTIARQRVNRRRRL